MDERLKVSNDGSFAPPHDDAPPGDPLTPPADGATPAKQQAKEVAGQAKEQAQAVAGQAKERAQEVAGQASAQAQAAAQQAKQKAAAQVDEKTTQAGAQVASQGEALDGVADELRRQGKDGQANAVGQAAQKAKDVGDYLERTDGEQLVAAAQQAAKDNPAAAAAVGAAAGFVAGRVLKASSPEDEAEPAARPQPQGARS